MKAPSAAPQQITQLLCDWRNGDSAALNALIPLVQPVLQQLAHRYMSKERPGHTLQTTVLVHDAYLKLADQTHPDWQNRAHFFAVAAQLMRRIMVDHARQRQALKRGGGAVKVTFDEFAQQWRTAPSSCSRWISDRKTCHFRQAKSGSSGNALLRRINDGRNRRRYQSAREHRHSGMERGAGLALRYTERRKNRCNLSVGTHARRFFTTRWNARLTSALLSSTKAAPAIRFAPAGRVTSQVS